MRSDKFCHDPPAKITDAKGNAITDEDGEEIGDCGTEDYLVVVLDQWNRFGGKGRGNGGGELAIALAAVALVTCVPIVCLLACLAIHRRYSGMLFNHF
jgi:hypothetical protein